MAQKYITFIFYFKLIVMKMICPDHAKEIVKFYPTLVGFIELFTG